MGSPLPEYVKEDIIRGKEEMARDSAISNKLAQDAEHNQQQQ